MPVTIFAWCRWCKCRCLYKKHFFPANPCRGLPTTLAGLRGSPRGSSGNAGLGGGGGGGMRSTKESTAKGDTTGHGKIRYGIRT